MLEQTSSPEPSSAEDHENGRWRTGWLEPPLGRGINFELTAMSLDDILLRLRGADCPLLLGLQEKAYGVGEGFVRTRRFLVADPDGYLFRFS